MSNKLKEITKEEWRELGFYYEQDENERNWNLVGSRNGLLKLTEILDIYCSNPRKKQLSEHDHLGPYMYLKIVTMNECVIDENGIYGSIVDLERLSRIVREALNKAKPFDRIIIDRAYSEINKYKIVLEVREEGFDPASEDSVLWN
jgi:hypothetical protein